MKTIGGFLLALVSSSALAEEPPFPKPMANAPALYDFTKPVVDDQGRVAHERAAKGDPLSYDEASPIWTVGHVAAAALQQQQQAAHSADPADYLKSLSRVALALRVRDCRACDVTTEEIREIETAVNAAFPPTFLYRVVEVIAPADLPKR